MITYLKWGILWCLLWNLAQFIGYCIVPDYNLFTFIVGVIIGIPCLVIAWIICVVIDCVKLKNKI